jgi:hypothetical protein
MHLCARRGACDAEEDDEEALRGTRASAPDLDEDLVRPPDRASTPKLTGGDVDADWLRAAASGEEGVGGSDPTPDQDVVDELGEALGVPRGPGEEFHSAAEILEKRDARRGHLES